MTKTEFDYLNTRISKVAKKTLEQESKKANMTMTAYLELLIEGGLTGNLEAEVKALRLEIEALRKQLKK
jgi:hypothetical protein